MYFSGVCHGELENDQWKFSRTFVSDELKLLD